MGKHYVTCSFAKIKNLKTNSVGSMKRCYDHNFRLDQPANANPDIDNKILCKTELDAVDDFNYLINKAIAEGNMTKVRKNAVLGIEAVLTYTKSETIDVDIDSWAKDSLEWLQKKFGQDNVRNAVLHLDEANPHIHAIIVPMDEHGKLNCKHFIDGPKSLAYYQTNYAEEVGNKYGLSRGTRYSTQRKLANDYKNIARYKAATIGKAFADAEVIKALDTELDENGHIIPERYYPRVKKAFEDHNLAQLSEINDLKQEVNEAESYFREQEFLMRKEIEDEKKKYHKILEKIAELFNSIKARILSGEITLNELIKKVTFIDAFERGIKNYPDRDKAHNIAKGANDIAEWQHKKDKENIQEFDKKINL